MQAVSADIIDVLGETATYTPFGGAAVSINIIFYAEQIIYDPYGQLDDKTPPHALVKSIDTTGAKHRDSIRVDGVTYEITKATPDGLGVTELALNKI